jgi:hypothetical protein
MELRTVRPEPATARSTVAGARFSVGSARFSVGSAHFSVGSAREPAASVRSAVASVRLAAGNAREPVASVRCGTRTAPESAATARGDVAAARESSATAREDTAAAREPAATAHESPASVRREGRTVRGPEARLGRLRGESAPRRAARRRARAAGGYGCSPGAGTWASSTAPVRSSATLPEGLRARPRTGKEEARPDQYGGIERQAVLKPRRGFTNQPRVSEAPPWVSGDQQIQTLKGFYRAKAGVQGKAGICKTLSGFAHPGWRFTQGGASLTLGWLVEPLRGSRRQPTERSFPAG